MKSKELIRILQETDPNGETEVTIDGADIYCVARYPGYYDGCYQVITRDPSKTTFNIVKIKRTRAGEKIRLHTYSIEDLIWDGWDIQSGGKVEIDNFECPSYNERDEATRKEVKACDEEIALKNKN